MLNQAMARGAVLIGIALFFGLPAAGYPLGTLTRAGPGLFPLIVSGLVGLIGLLTLLTARREPRQPLSVGARNIGIVLAALIGFALIAHHVNVIVATVFLVFVATLAGSGYSIRRNLQISAVLVAIAFAFKIFLGLQLPLY